MSLAEKVSRHLSLSIATVAITLLELITGVTHAADKPNIVLVMADDQGWGQVGYNGHPVLKTPNLDAMADSGLRFNRFYAAGPVCSPTRASVLTGRTHKRTGVPSHGHNLCLQEKTLPNALLEAGYATGHFGKWHLNGVRGAGVPILATDENHPGHYGFEEWLSVTNYFDLDPLMSRHGKFESYQGDSSNIIVREALKFMERQTERETPFLSVIWYGSPHNPQRALEQDRKGLPEGKVNHHLGEIVGIDRSIGTLRAGLRKLGIENNTIVWYCSDNGGLNLDPNAVGSLRGHKGELYEGGIRVPGIIEWPGRIAPATTDFPVSTMDIFPTIVELLNLPSNSMLDVHDGESIAPLLEGEEPERTHAIPFSFQKNVALIDGDYKLLGQQQRKTFQWQLFDLQSDPGENKDISATQVSRFEQMKRDAESLVKSIANSEVGQDYPEGKVIQPARSAFWRDMPEYAPHLKEFAEYFQTTPKKKGRDAR